MTKISKKDTDGVCTSFECSLGFNNEEEESILLESIKNNIRCLTVTKKLSEVRNEFNKLQDNEKKLRESISELWSEALANVRKNYDTGTLDPRGKGLNLIYKFTGVSPVRFNKFVENTTDRNYIPTEEEYTLIKYLLQLDNRLEDYTIYKDYSVSSIPKIGE